MGIFFLPCIACYIMCLRSFLLHFTSWILIVLLLEKLIYQSSFSAYTNYLIWLGVENPKKNSDLRDKEWKIQLGFATYPYEDEKWFTSPSLRTCAKPGGLWAGKEEAFFFFFFLNSGNWTRARFWVNISCCWLCHVRAKEQLSLAGAFPSCGGHRTGGEWIL